jgi:hypothetical protein
VFFADLALKERRVAGFCLNNSSTWMRPGRSMEAWKQGSGRDDSNPSAALFGARSMLYSLEHFHQFCSRFVYCIGLGHRQAASK